MSAVCQDLECAHGTHRAGRVPVSELRNAADEEDVLREDDDQHRDSARTDRCNDSMEERHTSPKVVVACSAKVTLTVPLVGVVLGAEVGEAPPEPV